MNILMESSKQKRIRKLAEKHFQGFTIIRGTAEVPDTMQLWIENSSGRVTHQFPTTVTMSDTVDLSDSEIISKFLEVKF